MCHGLQMLVLPMVVLTFLYSKPFSSKQATPLIHGFLLTTAMADACTNRLWTGHEYWSQRTWMMFCYCSWSPTKACQTSLTCNWSPRPYHDRWVTANGKHVHSYYLHGIFVTYIHHKHRSSIVWKVSSLCLALTKHDLRHSSWVPNSVRKDPCRTCPCVVWLEGKDTIL